MAGSCTKLIAMANNPELITQLTLTWRKLTICGGPMTSASFPTNAQWRLQLVIHQWLEAAQNSRNAMWQPM